MNASKFDQIVKARAQQRIEARVSKFRSDVALAFQALFTGMPYADSPFNFPSHSRSEISGQYLSKAKAQSALNGLFYGENNQPQRITLPASFWETEEAEVSKQLLATMDEMQKALCAPIGVTPTAFPEA